jgi:hypothetical protein
MRNENTGKLIKPPNELINKVIMGGPCAVNEATLVRAEQVVDNLLSSYLDWASEDLSRIQIACDALKEVDGLGDLLDAVFQISHDIKGQGGSFGYNLMTTIGDMLCCYIESLGQEASPHVVEVIQLHIDALQAVISQKLKGDGGAVGRKILLGLELVIKKRTTTS